MTENTFVRARISEDVKTEAAEVLDQLGLTVSDVVRITLTRVARERGLPFEMRVPNETTAETLKKSDRGEELHRPDSVQAMFDDLGI